MKRARKEAHVSRGQLVHQLRWEFRLLLVVHKEGRGALFVRAFRKGVYVCVRGVGGKGYHPE